MRILPKNKIPNSYSWVVCIYDTSKTEYIINYFLALQKTINELKIFSNMEVTICFNFIKLPKSNVFSIQSILSHQKEIMPNNLGTTFIIDGEDHFLQPWKEISNIIEDAKELSYPVETFAASIPSFKMWTLLQKCNGGCGAKEYALFLDNSGLYTKAIPEHYTYVVGGYKKAFKCEDEINELHLNDKIQEYSNIGTCIRNILQTLCDNHYINLAKVERKI